MDVSTLRIRKNRFWNDALLEEALAALVYRANLFRTAVRRDKLEAGRSGGAASATAWPQQWQHGLSGGVAEI